MGNISEGHGRALLAIPGLAERFSAMQEIKEKGLSVRDTESLAQALKKSPRQRKALTSDKELVKAFKDALGADVKVLQTKKGGKVTISFSSNAELEGILQKLKGA